MIDERESATGNLKIDLILEKWRHSTDISPCITRIERLPARTGRWADFPSFVHEELVSVLKKRGISRLYAHQREALEAVRQELGDDAVILKSEKVPRSGFFDLMKGDMVEVVAAVDEGDGLHRPAAEVPAQGGKLAYFQDKPAAARTWPGSTHHDFGVLLDRTIKQRATQGAGQRSPAGQKIPVRASLSVQKPQTKPGRKKTSPQS